MILQGTTLQAPRVDSPAPDASDVRFWLFAVTALIFAMVLVGGATRLTESGLSITQWKPLTGVIHPSPTPAGATNSRAIGESEKACI
jgi:hypothetical protein